MTVIAIRYIPPNRIEPNPWNPNVMTDEMFRKEVESIREFGFIDPVTVRKMNSHWQIIDGENRWRGAKELSLKEIPAIVLDVDDVTAEQLTIVLNETRGKPDPIKLRELIITIAEKRERADMERILPLKRQQLMEMLDEKKVETDWSALQAPKERESERWVERIYRLPLGAAEVVDQAIGKARTQEDLSFDWQALEMIAADFMGS